jgi:hypothetical protein
MRKVLRGVSLPKPDDGSNDPESVRRQKEAEARLLAMGDDPDVEELDPDQLDEDEDAEERVPEPAHRAPDRTPPRQTQREALTELGAVLRSVPGEALKIHTRDAVFSITVYAYSETDEVISFMLPMQYTADFKSGVPLTVERQGTKTPVTSLGAKIQLQHVDMFVTCFLIGHYEESK